MIATSSRLAALDSGLVRTIVNGIERRAREGRAKGNLVSLPSGPKRKNETSKPRGSFDSAFGKEGKKRGENYRLLLGGILCFVFFLRMH
jgi:hypothetical protein